MNLLFQQKNYISRQIIDMQFEKMFKVYVEILLSY